ncbi:MAG: phosphotransferase family protein, partial [Dehalococcoidia bacterium]
SGGASLETWSWDATIEHPGNTEQVPGILRCEPSAGYEPSVSRQLEYWSIRAAWESGAKVPEPLWDGDDTFDRRFMTMKRVEGETLGGRLVRGEQYAHARDVFAEQLGHSIARIHNIDLTKYPALNERLPRPGPEDQPADMVLKQIEASFRSVAKDPHPVFELAFRWLRAGLPPATGQVFVHADFRLGNVIFGEDGVRAIIDWEAAHIGDPMEDLSWVMMRSWRFGGKKPVAGVGDREPFIQAYEAESGRAVDRVALRWWEVYATLRWGVITLTQCDLYYTGRYRNVEMAAIGRRAAETEIELLNQLEQA